MNIFFQESIYSFGILNKEKLVSRPQENWTPMGDPLIIFLVHVVSSRQGLNDDLF
jgi:hypothetical protein